MTSWLHQHPWKVTLIALFLVLEVIMITTRGIA